MKKDNKKALYENIMASVAKEVKKALNEYDDWTTTTTLDPTKLDEDQSDSDFVDLGLSVKWAKYNLGAKPSKKAKDCYGNYYAWGETEPKSKYTEYNYKYIDSMGNMVKYNEKDHQNILTPNDDAATVNCNRPWRMPTKEECEELMTLQNQWVINYDGVTGLNGRVFIGKNGNELFIPAAGYRDGSSDICNDMSAFCLWSSSLNVEYPYSAYYLFFFDYHNVRILHSNRFFGFSVRPVMD